MIDLRDELDPRPVSESRTVYDGMVWSIGRDTIEFTPGVVFDREYMNHPGAVAILAFTVAGEAILIRQYRHPAKSILWEIPAGLMDHEGELAEAAAIRELAEETGYRPGRIQHLLDYFPSPGGSTEVIRIFVAFECTRDAKSDFVREAEEKDIEVHTVPFGQLYEAAHSGQIGNGTLITAALAYGAKMRD